MKPNDPTHPFSWNLSILNVVVISKTCFKIDSHALIATSSGLTQYKKKPILLYIGIKTGFRSKKTDFWTESVTNYLKL